MIDSNHDPHCGYSGRFRWDGFTGGVSPLCEGTLETEGENDWGPVNAGWRPRWFEPSSPCPRDEVRCSCGSGRRHERHHHSRHEQGLSETTPAMLRLSMSHVHLLCLVQMTSMSKTTSMPNELTTVSPAGPEKAPARSDP